MKCVEVISFLADYLDGTLPAEVGLRFEAHLAGCSSCTAYLASYRETIRVARAAAKAPALHVAEVPEELIAAILDSAR